MSTESRELLIRTLLSIPDNGIVCASYLIKLGLSHDNLKQYVRRGHLDSIGRGAYCKHGHTPSFSAAINAAVEQLDIPLHLGGWSALGLRGLLHFLPSARMPNTLYAPVGTRLPAWFESSYASNCVCRRTKLFPGDIGIEHREVDRFNIPVSTPERAILEYLYDVPEKHSLNEAFQILEMMYNARPDLLQSLLESCCSIKVKRLFLLLSEDLNQSWYEDLDVGRIGIGSGNRIIEKGGSYRNKWLVTVKDWREV